MQTGLKNRNLKNTNLARLYVAQCSSMLWAKCYTVYHFHHLSLACWHLIISTNYSCGWAKWECHAGGAYLHLQKNVQPDNVATTHPEGEHEFLHQIPWQSIQYSSKHLIQNHKCQSTCGTRGKVRVHQVIRIQPLGTTNVCTKSHGNSCWDISVKKVIVYCICPYAGTKI